MSNVTAIHGNTVPNEVDQDIILMAERFLARCKAGEVKSAYICWVRGSGMPSHAVEYRPDSICALHSGMVCAADQMTKILNENTGPPNYDPLDVA